MCRDESKRDESDRESKSDPHRPRGGDRTTDELIADERSDEEAEPQQTASVGTRTKHAVQTNTDSLTTTITLEGAPSQDATVVTGNISDRLTEVTTALTNSVRPVVDSDTGDGSDDTQSNTTGPQKRWKASITTQYLIRTHQDTIDRVVDPQVATEVKPATIELTTRKPAVETEATVTTQIMRPEERGFDRENELELDLEDPVFTWGGGTPYGTRRPQLVLNFEPESYATLPFLERVLRDTYTELEEGRPRTTRVGPTDHHRQLPSVQGGIVTIDLTADGYDVSIEGEQVTIETGSSTDLVSTLRAEADSMYGGQLGYLVLNINKSDVQSGFTINGPQKLLAALIDNTSGHKTAEDSLLEVAGAPVRIAQPRVDHETTFIKRVREYFALISTDHQRIADIETQQDRILNGEDWPRIALTERQEGAAAESDEHYLWKAAIVDGLVRRLRVEYISNHRDVNEEFSIAQFVSQELLETGILTTETAIGDSDSDGEAPIADLYLDTTNTWVWNAVRDFIDADIPKGSELIIEFETGRREGAFNHRKLRESVEKYDSGTSRVVAVVVPPRLLFASSQRARLALRLVDIWPTSEDAPAEATLYVPVLDSRSCVELEAAVDRIESWFGDTDA